MGDLGEPHDTHHDVGRFSQSQELVFVVWPLLPICLLVILTTRATETQGGTFHSSNSWSRRMSTSYYNLVLQTCQSDYKHG